MGRAGSGRLSAARRAMLPVMSPEARHNAGGGGRFATTRWSLVARAGGTAGPEVRAALSDLCAQYWPPVYAYLRRRSGPEEAADLTQDFFARLLARNDLGGLDPRRGRFRSWLLASVEHYLSNQRDHQRAQKRGGGQPMLSLDVGDEERSFPEPSNSLTAEQLYLRRWTLLMIGRARAALEEEHRREGRARQFDVLGGYLTGEAEAPYEEVARELGSTPGAVKVAVHRLRVRFRERLRAEILETVESPAAVDEELRYLLANLG
jgi:RNA polymerase sigma factor (sigma-70 family)